MKTIEQYEAEIAARSAAIEQQLAIFQTNLSHLGVILDRDPKVVYQVLVDKYNDTINAYESTTRRNTEILQGYVDRLDKIQGVLDLVMRSVDQINQSEQESGLVPGELIKEVEATLDSAASEVQSIVSEETGVVVQVNYIVPGIVFVGSYALLRLLGVSKTVSALGSGAATYLMATAGRG